MKTIILKTKKRNLKNKCSKCETETSHKNKFCPTCGVKMPKFDTSKLKYGIPQEIEMPMREEVKGILRVYIESRKPKFKPPTYLFRKWALITLKKKIKIHCKKASITKRFSLHGFRHYFITTCKKAGMSNEDIAKWTGHKDPKSINVYNRMVPDDVRAKIESVDL